MVKEWLKEAEIVKNNFVEEVEKEKYQITYLR